jgi:hypothetical protein
VKSSEDMSQTSKSILLIAEDLITDFPEKDSASAILPDVSLDDTTKSDCTMLSFRLVVETEEESGAKSVRKDPEIGNRVLTEGAICVYHPYSMPVTIAAAPPRAIARTAEVLHNAVVVSVVSPPEKIFWLGWDQFQKFELSSWIIYETLSLLIRFFPSSDALLPSCIVASLLVMALGVPHLRHVWQNRLQLPLELVCGLPVVIVAAVYSGMHVAECQPSSVVPCSMRYVGYGTGIMAFAMMETSLLTIDCISDGFFKTWRSWIYAAMVLDECAFAYFFYVHGDDSDTSLNLKRRDIVTISAVGGAVVFAALLIRTVRSQLSKNSNNVFSSLRFPLVITQVKGVEFCAQDLEKKLKIPSEASHKHGVATQSISPTNRARMLPDQSRSSSPHTIAAVSSSNLYVKLEKFSRNASLYELDGLIRIDKGTGAAVAQQILALYRGHLLQAYFQVIDHSNRMVLCPSRHVKIVSPTADSHNGAMPLISDHCPRLVNLCIALAVSHEFLRFDRSVTFKYSWTDSALFIAQIMLCVPLLSNVFVPVKEFVPSKEKGRTRPLVFIMDGKSWLFYSVILLSCGEAASAGFLLFSVNRSLWCIAQVLASLALQLVLCGSDALYNLDALTEKLLLVAGATVLRVLVVYRALAECTERTVYLAAFFLTFWVVVFNIYATAGICLNGTIFMQCAARVVRDEGIKVVAERENVVNQNEDRAENEKDPEDNKAPEKRENQLELNENSPLLVT